MDPEKKKLIIEVLRLLLPVAEKLEPLLDPDEKTKVDDMLIKVLKLLVEYADTE